MILSGAEEQSHSVLCDSDDLLHVAIYSVKGHALGLLSQRFFLSSSWNSSEDAQVGSLAWLDVICLFSALKLSLWELHDCPVMGECCCRSAMACMSLQNKRILKEKSGSMRFCGSSFLHVWRTQRYQEVYIHSVPDFGGGWVPVLFMPQVRIARLVPEYDLKMDFKEMIVQSLLGH